MKTITLLIASIFSISLQAQSFPINQNGDIEYTDVITADGYSKDDLYIQARSWMAKNFKNANEVIQMDDKEAGRIIGKGVVMLSNASTFGWINYTLEIQLKDGRYKYSISNVRHELPIGSKIVTPGVLTSDKLGGGIFTMGKPRWDKIKLEVANRLSMLDLRLKTIISSDKLEEEW